MSTAIGRALLASRRRSSPGSRRLLVRVFGLINVLRIGLAAHAIAVNVQRGAAAAHPGLLVAAMIVMVAWTAIAGLVYSRPGGRRLPWYIVDVVIAGSLVAASDWILGTSLYQKDWLSVTVFWAVCAPVAVAVCHSTRWGVVAALVVATARVAVTPTADPALWSTYVIMVFVAAGVGIMVDFLLTGQSERDRALAETAAIAERERLNRIVHDGVLQVLTLVEREGPGMGVRGMRLAQLAHEQEVKLRLLLQDRDVQVGARDDDSRRDLVAMLDRQAAGGVTISTMADEVLVAPHVADEVDAVVSEILANVRKHAGPHAQAWLLLEREGNEVIVSVRDNGVGTTSAELTGAADRGRLGVRNSIIGRVRDLGGQATVRTSPGRGVEWELRIPVA